VSEYTALALSGTSGRVQYPASITTKDPGKLLPVHAHACDCGDAAPGAPSLRGIAGTVRHSSDVATISSALSLEVEPLHVR
jgi:hypothetical protein